MTARRHMVGFGEYVGHLQDLLYDIGGKRTATTLAAALDGEPWAEIRRLVKTQVLKQTGTFFTGKPLARVLLSNTDPSRGSLIADPACGAGDLLIAVAARLPLQSTFETTVEKWGSMLAGCDIHPELVRATKLRLCLVALSRGQYPKKAFDYQPAFPNIVVADGLTQTWNPRAATIVMNPPFVRMQAPRDCSWAEGAVSSAAVFADTWLNRLRPDDTLLGILPDVLRSGTNYRHWRQRMRTLARIEWLRVLGSFDGFADVDVFAICFRRTQKSSSVPVAPQQQWGITRPHSTMIGDLFDIHVGAVVPHRDRKRGSCYPYLHTGSVQPWAILRRITERIRTEHRVFAPPFVLIRRTSSPRDAQRAIGAVVLGKRRVAVENHLLVALPRKAGVQGCLKLLQILRSRNTTEWLNSAIRCRHLTVGAVASIPWAEADIDY